jgi:hypothetical protein
MPISDFTPSIIGLDVGRVRDRSRVMLVTPSKKVMSRL